MESGHPHLQVIIWSKQRDKMNYFVNYKEINKMRDEFSNLIFKEDLIELYKKKDNVKKQIVASNSFFNEMKKVSTDKKFLKDMLQYEKDFYNKKLMKQNLHNYQLEIIVDDLLKIKDLLKQTAGSIKYQYLKKYPDIIKEIDNYPYDKKEAVNDDQEMTLDEETVKPVKKVIKKLENGEQPEQKPANPEDMPMNYDSFPRYYDANDMFQQQFMPMPTTTF